MHDPMVVAFEIRRPWPTREKRPLSRKTGRWEIQGPFWTLAGRLHLYWPSMITIWHDEPGGRDSGEVCKHYRRDQQPDGTWKTTILNGWRWHIHHWKIQVRPLQDLRRWLLTKCEWCGGPSRKGDLVNTSHQWHSEPGPWWRGQRGLYHRQCSPVALAHRSCTCELPVLEHRDYGTCAVCGLFRPYGRSSSHLAASRVLKAGCRPGQRPDSAAFEQAEAHWAAEEGSS